jgi:hypothetical protein
MDMDKWLGQGPAALHEQVAWTCTCSMDTQHWYGHAAWRWNYVDTLLQTYGIYIKVPPRRKQQKKRYSYPEKATRMPINPRASYFSKDKKVGYTSFRFPASLPVILLFASPCKNTLVYGGCHSINKKLSG